MHTRRPIADDDLHQKAYWTRKYIRARYYGQTYPLNAALSAFPKLITFQITPLQDAIEQVPISVAKLATVVDFSAQIENEGAEPELTTLGLTWSSFQSTWAQQCRVEEAVDSIAYL